MFLQRLVGFEPVPKDGPQRPYSRDRTIRWQLNLNAAGSFVGLTDLADPSDKTRKAGVRRTAPHLARAGVGASACIGTDDIQYVLGWPDENTKPERVAQCHDAFVALCEAWARSAVDDPVAAAIVAFYQSGALETIEKPTDKKWSAKDLVLLSVAGEPATDRDSLWQFWQTEVEGRKSGTGSDGAARQGICLVCGIAGSLLNRMPQALPKTLVPRADNEVALLSANKKIHTYDFSEGLGTAPVCVRCGQRAIENLSMVLSDQDQTFTYAGQSTRLAWWTTGAQTDAVRQLNADARDIKDYLDRITSGVRPRRLGTTERFCAVTISGNISRLVVHEWIDLPLFQVEENIQAWFVDHAIVGRRDGEDTHFPIWRLVLAFGRWIDSTNVYAKLDDKSADRPRDVAQALTKAALLGRDSGHLPPTLLAHLVRRVRTDRRVDEARVALLRLLMRRITSVRLEAPMPGLDDSYNNPAYLAGRIFAVLESVQRAAYPRDDAPNTTFFHRYFSGAVTNPAIAVTQGLQLFPAWIKKIEGRAGTRGLKSPGMAASFALRSRLTNLHDRYEAASNGVPRQMDIEQQGAFVLGYFHQSAHDQQAARDARTAKAEVDAEA